VRTARRNPDLLGDLIFAGILVGGAIVGIRAFNGLKIPGLQLPDPGTLIDNSLSQAAHEAGLTADGAIYTVTGMPSQNLVDSTSPSDLEKNWDAWQGPFGPLSFIGKPPTVNALIDQWFNGAGGLIFGIGAYDPTSWGAFTSWVKLTYDFTFPSHSIPYFDQRAAPLGGTK